MRDVSREIRRFDPTRPLAEAETPPSSWYTEPSIDRLERRRVFGASWNVLGRADQVQEPGSFLAGRLVDEPVVAVRDRDGTLRAFANSCRHHATRVADGAGRCEELVCPYHGWAYALDGRLTRAPGVGAIRNLDPARTHLPELAAEVCGPLLLVHPSRPRTTAAAALAPATRTVGASLDDLVFVERRVYPVACNWKVFVDNYLDGGYHVPHLHGGLASQLDLASYQTELLERACLQTCGGRADRIGDRAWYLWMYPNIMWNRYGPVLDVNVVVPVDATRCEVVFDWYLERDQASDRALVERCIDESERVQQEDIAVSEAVQVGLSSTHFDTGRYAPSHEAGAHLFHRLLYADLAGHDVSESRPATPRSIGDAQ